jgi:23S rRNA (uracil1939-C5)-methyltransferase
VIVPLLQQQRLDLTVEKPAAGGRMIARHEGQVILVQGAIPGERVVAAVERVERHVAFARTVEVLDPSPDRRSETADLSCGGCSYAHIDYHRQLQLKGEVVRDAFARLGRLSVDAPHVASSPDRGYRMRARLHVRGERVGFFREGTHDLCDAAATGQLPEASVNAVAACVTALARRGVAVSALELTENIAGDERAANVIPAAGSDVTGEVLGDALTAAGLTGLTALGATGVTRTAGVPVVADPLSALTAGAAISGTLQRHAESFFQANRFLLPSLVGEVTGAVAADETVLDLYAGVGLFSVALAAVGRRDITAIEGDRTSGRDLMNNAAPYGEALRVYVESVEEYLKRRTVRAAAVIVDPPRSGISRDAMAAVVRAAAKKVVYVSCDPATMARDARRLVDGGYEVASLTAFDLFPNTPHVESVGVFIHSSG